VRSFPKPEGGGAFRGLGYTLGDLERGNSKWPRTLARGEACSFLNGTLGRAATLWNKGKREGGTRLSE